MYHWQYCVDFTMCIRLAWWWRRLDHLPGLCRSEWLPSSVYISWSEWCLYLRTLCTRTIAMILIITIITPANCQSMHPTTLGHHYALTVRTSAHSTTTWCAPQAQQQTARPLPSEATVFCCGSK